MDSLVRRLKSSVMLSPSPMGTAGASSAVNGPIAFAAATAKRPESPMAKMVIGGVMTVMFEALADFLEFLKIAKQTSPNETYAQITRRIVQHKGIAGTLDGFVPWGLGQCIVKGAVFSWGHATALYYSYDQSLVPESVRQVWAGGMGGLVQGIVMSPMLLLKTRVMTDAAFRTTGTAWETTKQSSLIGVRVVREEGLMALTKGMPVFAMKRFFDWTTRFLFVQLVEDAVQATLGPGEQLSKGSKIGCALAGGTLSALATIPIDVLVAQVQQANQAGKGASVVDIIRKASKENIFEFATRGLVARVSHVALTTLIMKQATSVVYDKLYR